MRSMLWTLRSLWLELWLQIWFVINWISLRFFAGLSDEMAAETMMMFSIDSLLRLGVSRRAMHKKMRSMIDESFRHDYDRRRLK